MNSALQSRWLLAVLGILVAGNLILTLLLWQGHSNGPKRPLPPPRPENAAAVLKEKLDWNEQQVTAFRSLLKEHQEKIRMYQDSLRHLKHDLFESLPGNPGDAEVTAATEQIGHVYQAIEVATFQHLKDVRNLCTPEQQAKFDKIIHEILPRPGMPPPPIGNTPPR